MDVVDIVSVAALLLSSVCCSVQPEELTLLLIKLRRQQAELNSLREHTVAQLMALGMEGPNPKVSTGCMCVCMHAFGLSQPSIKNPIFCVDVCLQGEVPCVHLGVYSKWNLIWCVLKGLSITHYGSSPVLWDGNVSWLVHPLQFRLKYQLLYNWFLWTCVDIHGPQRLKPTDFWLTSRLTFLVQSEISQ